MTAVASSGLLQRMPAVLADLRGRPSQGPHAALSELVRQGLDRLPAPGSGATLQRWQALAAVAAHDLSLVKLYEGHTDALAILQELGASPLDSPGATYGVWAAEAPAGRVRILSGSAGRLALHGLKAWCSGAADVSHGLLTAWPDDTATGPQLVRVAMRQPGVSCDADAWHAVGMQDSQSIDVSFEGAVAEPVGRAGDYLRRPGFWQGGAGIAACWFGGASAVAEALRGSLDRSSAARRTALRLASLGRIDLALQGTAAVLREAARWIDAHPRDDAQAVALRVRLSAEACCQLVLAEAGRALGAAPFCHDAHFARMAADLPVFIRQSHADADLAALGECLVAGPPSAWSL